MDNFAPNSFKVNGTRRVKIFFGLLKNNLTPIIPILLVVIFLPTVLFLNLFLNKAHEPKPTPPTVTKKATEAAKKATTKNETPQNQTPASQTNNNPGNSNSGNTTSNSNNNSNIKAVGTFSVLIVEFAGPNSADREVLISPGKNLQLPCTYQWTNKTTVRTVMNGPSAQEIITFVQGCATIPAPPGTYLTYADLTMPNLKYFATYLSSQAAIYSKTLTINTTIVGPYQVSGLVAQGSADMFTPENAISENAKGYIQNFFKNQMASKGINTASYDFVLILYFDDQQMQKNTDGTPKMVNGQFVHDHSDAFADFSLPLAKKAYININENIVDYISGETVSGVSFGQSWNVGDLISQITHQLLHLFGATEKGGAITNVIPIMTYPYVALNSANAPTIVVGPLTAAEIGWR